MKDGESAVVDVDAAQTRWYRSDRVLYRVVAVLTVTPILIAAVRAGLGTWTPAFDEGLTVMRARFALGLHLDLTGIYTDASAGIHTPTYFPGPWWLWWMAIPVRVLGTRWGPLLAIATLNSAWLLLAGFVVRRRFGFRTAMAALVFLAALTWSLGNSALYSPSGQVMIVPVFGAFLFIAWTLAAGDERALPAFALIVNFIVLDEVVLTRLLPILAACALGIWLVGLLDERRRRATAWPDLRRRSLRNVAWAGAITAIMWLPPLIQQVTHHPGNLTNLWRAAQATPMANPIWRRAGEVLLSFFAGPPFWLRGSRVHNRLYFSLPPSDLALVATALILVALIVSLGTMAIRRRDRPALSALALAVAVLVSTWYNLARPPDVIAGPLTWIGYYLSTWASAMFVTFAIVYAFTRAVPNALRKARTAILVGVASILAIANIPHANLPDGTYQSTDDIVRVASDLNAQIETAVAGQGRVALARPDLYSFPLVIALSIHLVDAGIPFCVHTISQWRDLPLHSCDHFDAQSTINFHRTAFTDPSTFDHTVIAQYDPLDPADHRELRRLTQIVDSAIQSAPPLQLSHAQRESNRKLLGIDIDPEFLGVSGGPLSSVSTRSQFANLIASTARWQAGAAAVHIPGVSDRDLIRWAQLESRYNASAFTVTATPSR